LSRDPACLLLRHVGEFMRNQPNARSRIWIEVACIEENI
jgi:hypothetical protein